MAESTPTLLSYKGAVTTINQAGSYQLVDNDTQLESTSTILIDANLVEGDVFIYLPYSVTTYTGNNTSGLINVICVGTPQYKIGILPAKVVKPQIPDTINGDTNGINIDANNGAAQVDLYFGNRWKASKFPL